MLSRRRQMPYQGNKKTALQENLWVGFPDSVIPADAGIQMHHTLSLPESLDSGIRRNDVVTHISVTLHRVCPLFRADSQKGITHKFNISHGLQEVSGFFHSTLPMNLSNEAKKNE